MDNLPYFYERIGQEAVTSKLEDLFYYASRQIVLWNPEKDEVFDEGRNREIIQCLLKIDGIYVPGILANLYTAEYTRAGDFKGMLNQMREAFKYNLFKGNRGLEFFGLHMQLLTRCTDPAVLQEGIDWIDEKCAATDNNLEKFNLVKYKAGLLRIKGDTAAADQATRESEEYKDLLQSGMKGRK